MQKKEFELEHCRLNCPKLARDWNSLYHLLNKQLSKLNISKAIEDKFRPVLYHHLPKISLAGCPNGCSQPNIKDFGISGYVTPKITTVECSECKICVNTCLEKAITWQTNGITIDQTICLSCGDCQNVCPTVSIIAGESGWTLRMGGRVGRHPKFAQFAGKVTTDKEVVVWIIEKMFSYIEEGRPQERLTHFLER